MRGDRSPILGDFQMPYPSEPIVSIVVSDARLHLVFSTIDHPCNFHVCNLLQASKFINQFSQQLRRSLSAKNISEIKSDHSVHPQEELRISEGPS